MASEDVVMVIEKPHFTVKLQKTVLQVDLKEGVKKELEDFLESKRIIRETLGVLFQTAVPMDVPLKDIDSVNADEKGRVKIAIRSRRDLHIPLTPKESKRLVEKLNELIPVEKDRAMREFLESAKVRETLEPGIARAEEESYGERLRRV